MLTLTLPAGMRLDLFLTQALSEAESARKDGMKVSRTEVQRLIDEGSRLKINGINPEKIKASFKGKTDLQLTVSLPARQKVELKPFSAKIPILFEDAHLAVVHKPAGMTVHPGAGTKDDTLVHALLGSIGKLSDHAERPGIVHRLDRDTEGLMVVAKTNAMHAALSQAFQEHEISKQYTAIIWGRVTLPEDLSGFIWRDLRNRKRMRFAAEAPESVRRARSAETQILSQQQHRVATLIQIALITGRTHQIRATCAALNAPVIGDSIYGNDATQARLLKIGAPKKKSLASEGLLLVANHLEFIHPKTRKKLSFKIALPDRFDRALKILK